MIHWRCQGTSGETIHSWNVLMKGIEANADVLDVFIAHRQ